MKEVTFFVAVIGSVALLMAFTAKLAYEDGLKEGRLISIERPQEKSRGAIT